MTTVLQSETARLAALRRYQILDTDFEKEYDDIVKLASQICQTPMSLIGLIDDRRQWYKAKQGLDGTEVQKDQTFCVHTILQNDVLIVPDASQDPHFKNNPSVTDGLKIRFYGGKPLTTPDGYNVGTLCVIDTQPRTLTEEQKFALDLLGRQVIAHMELKLQIKQLEEDKSKSKLYNSVIAQLNAQDIESLGSKEEIYRFITDLACKNLKTDRSSIWLYNDEHCLVRQNFAENGAVTSYSKELLQELAKYYVTYFKELNTKLEIAAEDVFTHPATAAFTKTLDFFGIKSVLVLPIVLNGKILGFMCHANQKHRKWVSADISFAHSLSDFITIGMQVLERKQTREELRKAHQIAEKHLQDLRSSINYAKRIQNAIILHEADLQKHFDCFVFFRPKGIVSGDFYWFTKKGKIKFLALADCTGHGVSGAFMTMIGNNILNQIINDYVIYEPNEILNKIPVLLWRTLKTTENNVSDGMDIAILAIQTVHGGLGQTQIQVEYAGAKNPLYYIKNEHLHEIEADKMHIFAKNQEEDPYTKHTLLFEETDDIILYLFSDGFKDQFGGEQNRKFLTKNFKKLLLDISRKPMNEQRVLLDSAFEEWKGEKEQTDDVTVIGLRL